MTEINPLLYNLIVAVLLVIKHFKEGNTSGSILQYISALLIAVGDLTGSNLFIYIGIVITIINICFVVPKIYTLPDF